MLKKLLCATLASAAFFTSASSITANYTIAKDSTPSVSTVDVAKFDDMMGTLVLESVMFSFSGQIETTIDLVNPTDKAQTDIGYNVTGELMLSDTMNVTLLSLPSISGSVNVPANTTVTTGLLASSDTVMATYSDAATLAAFTGLDDIVMDFTGTAESTFTGSGNAFSLVITNVFGSVEVTYNYSTVPVSAPAHVMLLGCAVLAFAGFRKSRH